MESPTKLTPEQEKMFCEMMVLENKDNALFKNAYSMQFVERPEKNHIHWYQYLVEVLLIKVVGYNPFSFGSFIQQTVNSDDKIHPVEYLYDIFVNRGKKFTV